MSYPLFANGDILYSTDMNAVGMWRVAGGSLAGATTNFQGCFSGSYRDYRIVIDTVNFSSAGDIYFRMLTGSTPETSANYSWAYRGLYENGTSADSNLAGYNAGYTGVTSGTAGAVLNGCSIDIYGPQLTQRTLLTSNAVAYNNVAGFGGRNGMTLCNLTNAYTGIQFLTLGPNVTGTVNIYGYRIA